MSEDDRRQKHAEYWRQPFESVAGQTAGHMVAPPDFQTVELLANIKRGSEVVLGGVASMPDVLDKIRTLRLEQDNIITQERAIVDKFQKDTANGISEEKRKELLAKKEADLAPLHAQFKRTRMEFAKFAVGSLVNHVLLETAAVDGKRAEQVERINTAQVLQDRNDILKLFPEKKKRSLRHPLGGE